MTTTPRQRSTAAEPYVKIPVRVLFDPELSDRAVRLYGALANYQGRNGFGWALRSTLAAAIGCSMPSITRAIAELRRAGVLDVRARFGTDGAQISNAYTVQTGSGITGDQGPSSLVIRGLVTGDQQNQNQENQNQRTSAVQLGRERHQRAADDTDDDFDPAAVLAAIKTTLRSNR